MHKPIADLWYGIEACEGDIVHIRETHIDQWAAGDIWLICGSDIDLVFDTGTGIVPLEPLVSMLSNKPKLAVSCCYYYDHAGGLDGFEKKACHPFEARLLSNPPERAEELVEESFYAHPYKGFQPESYRQKPVVSPQFIDEGDIIDLGNRQLSVLHIPGRTPGSIALWEESTGFLFGGETAFIDPFGHDFPPEQSVELYETSLKRLSKLPVKRVFGGHYGIFGSDQLIKLVDQEVGRYDPLDSQL